MKMVRWILMLAVGIGFPSIGSASPPSDVILLPELPVVVPTPKPMPKTEVKKLTGETVYDIRCKVDCVVRAYPVGLVSISKDVIAAGETLRDKGDFYDGAKVHVYKGPLTIYSIKASSVGKVDIVITPVGFKAESEIVTVSLDVDNGTKPIPPPGPGPDPGPNPDPNPKPANEFRVIFCYETGTTQTKEENSVLFGKDVQAWLDANCTKDNGFAGWRRFDKNQDASTDYPAIKAAWAIAQPKLSGAPGAIIVADGKVEILALQKTQADQIALFKKYKEGK